MSLLIAPRRPQAVTSLLTGPRANHRSGADMHAFALRAEQAEQLD